MAQYRSGNEIIEARDLEDALEQAREWAPEQTYNELLANYLGSRRRTAMTLYQIRTGDASETIEARDLEDALEYARDWAREGAYDERMMVTVFAHELDPVTGERYEGWYVGDGRNARDEIAVGPHPRPEPSECGNRDADHSWRSPLELVGGCCENPGVYSRGGTAFRFHYVCSWCGMYKTVRTAGSQRNPGELPESIQYRPPDDRSREWVLRRT